MRRGLLRGREAARLPATARVKSFSFMRMLPLRPACATASKPRAEAKFAWPRSFSARRGGPGRAAGGGSLCVYPGPTEKGESFRCACSPPPLPSASPSCPPPRIRRCRPATAPDFITTGALAGRPFRLNLARALRNGPVVLYFYPRAFTEGCTLEARAFSEAAADFRRAGARVIGLSADELRDAAPLFGRGLPQRLSGRDREPRDDPRL